MRLRLSSTVYLPTQIVPCKVQAVELPRWRDWDSALECRGTACRVLWVTAWCREGHGMPCPYNRHLTRGSQLRWVSRLCRRQHLTQPARDLLDLRVFEDADVGADHVRIREVHRGDRGVAGEEGGDD